MLINSSINNKYHPTLIALANSDKKTQKQLLKVLDDRVIRILAQIAQNVISGNIPLDKKQVKRLKRYKSTLRGLRDFKRTAVRRDILLNQTGGFLPFLIPIIASAVGGLIGKVLK